MEMKRINTAKIGVLPTLLCNANICMSVKKNVMMREVLLYYTCKHFAKAKKLSQNGMKLTYHYEMLWLRCLSILK